MYKKLNITENHLQVLALFTHGFNKEYYIREVQRLLKISPRTAQLILGDLERKGIIESRVRGKIKTYKLKDTEIAKEYLNLVEQYKNLSFHSKKPMVREIITKIIPVIQGIGVIFGSYAKGLEREDSDLDIFIAGKCDENAIKKISRLYGIKINTVVYPVRIFKRELHRDYLLREVLKAHIVFLNAESFIRTVLRSEQGQMVLETDQGSNLS